MSTIMRYLRDPYNQVFKVTALMDSVFKIKINGLPYYTIAEINAEIEAIQDAFFPPEMDTLSKRFYWLVANQGTQLMLSNGVEMNRNPLHYFNSYANDICSLNPSVAVQLLRKYYGAQNMTFDWLDESEVLHGHGSMHISEHGWIDPMLRIALYKDKYDFATREELVTDAKLYTEPIRKTSDSATYTLAEIDVRYSNLIAFTANTIDNLKIVLPVTASFVLPIKSANAPKTFEGGNISPYASCLLTVPTGVTGVVEMPFTLTQVTGTGSVNVNGVTYNLPADEATLKTLLQTYATHNRIFEVLTNTGGITAEYLVNTKMYLFKKNTIWYELTSGNISISRIATATPVETNILSVDKKTKASWTLDFKNIFTNNKSFKAPRCTLNVWDKRHIYFSGASAGELAQSIYNYVANINYPVAATEKTDQCWSAKLMPRDDSFASTLELSFTAIDDSDTYYTVDGSTPDATKTKYTAPFTISATTTVKWINIKAGYADSHVNSRVITKS